MEYEDRIIMGPDPYNPQNYVKARIHTYYPKGHSVVTFQEINDVPVDITPISGTPIILHPLHPNGYNLTQCESMHSYEKYDGINVFAFQYQFNGETFTSYRSRFHPFFHPDTPCKILWDAVLEKYPIINSIFEYHPDFKGFSFEMYGSDCTRIFQYTEELDAALLFGVRKDGAIEHPINLHNTFDTIKSRFAGNDADADLTQRYFSCQDDMQKNLYKVSGSENKLRPKYEGDSGLIWYVKDKVSQQIHLVKCEPPELEDAPMPVADTQLSYTSIRSAIIKTNENFESGDTDNIIMVLQENYTNSQIRESFDRISEIVEDYNNEIELRLNVWTLMQDNNLNRATDVSEIIAKIRPNFDKSDMKDVYNTIRIIQKYGGVG